MKNGRYGPYVTHDGVNATLPNDKTPETITLEEAVSLLAARAERTGGKAGRHGGRREAGQSGEAADSAEAAKATPRPQSRRRRRKAANALTDRQAPPTARRPPAAAAARKPKKRPKRAGEARQSRSHAAQAKAAPNDAAGQADRTH